VLLLLKPLLSNHGSLPLFRERFDEKPARPWSGGFFVAWRSAVFRDNRA
jgi:hypothetical protein